MSETSLKPVIEKLENLFSKFNEKFYNGELQTPIITVSPDTTKGAYGWCTAWKAWSNKQPEQKKTADLAAMSKEDLENALLQLYNKKTRNLKIVNALGDTRVRAGSMVVINLALGDMNLKNFMLVEKVKHTFKLDQHFMDLTLRGGEFVA